MTTPLEQRVKDKGIEALALVARFRVFVASLNLPLNQHHQANELNYAATVLLNEVAGVAGVASTPQTKPQLKRRYEK